ncbi:hypothetical protein M422DRAFT_44406 [Sphaerobolus stellatus SS14]|nr:hypothetical protein M422DRAFT_44406 [Sphaerobolus stellatus SS14]
MPYPCTRSQPFFCPVTNRLSFSPEKSVTPPVLTKRLELESMPELPKNRVLELPKPDVQGLSSSRLKSKPDQPKAAASVANRPAVPKVKVQAKVQGQAKPSTSSGSAELTSSKATMAGSNASSSDATFSSEHSDTMSDEEVEFAELPPSSDPVSDESASDTDGFEDNEQDNDDNASMEQDDLEQDDADDDTHEQRTISNSESDSDTDSEVAAEDVIRKPPGSAGRPGGLGYSLKGELKSLGWTAKNLADMTAYMHEISPHYLARVQYSRQDPDKVKRLCKKVAKHFRALKLKNYEKHWAIKDFIKAQIKYTGDKLRVQRNNEPGPSSGKRHSDNGTHSNKAAKRRKIVSEVRVPRSDFKQTALMHAPACLSRIHVPLLPVKRSSRRYVCLALIQTNNYNACPRWSLQNSRSTAARNTAKGKACVE